MSSDNGNIGCGGIIALLIVIGAIGSFISYLADNPYILMLVISLVVLLILIKPIRNAWRKSKEEQKYNSYASLIGGYRETSVEYLAGKMGLTHDGTITDLQALQAKGYFDDSYFQNGLFIVPQNGKHRPDPEKAEPEEVDCPYCGKKILKGKKICEHCGNDLVAVDQVKSLRKENRGEAEEILKAVKDKTIVKQLTNITDLADLILDKLEKEPQKIKEAYRFTSYYLPQTLNVEKNYRQLCAATYLDSDEAELKKQMEDSFAATGIAFERILRKISMDDVFDLAADLSTLNNIMEQDGLTESGFDVDKQ